MTDVSSPADKRDERAMVFIPSKARPAYLRALIQRLLGRPDRAAELCRAALKTPDYSVAHLRAHWMLAELEFPGEDYFKVIARIHEYVKPATYLEIGIDQGDSFEIVRPETVALGVDPNPRPQKPLGPNQRVFALTSDDGLHLFEFALRDFINVEKYCSTDSLILIHDVYPLDATSAARERASTFWTGDIWRLILALKKYRPDLTVNVIATRPTGLAMVQNLDPTSRVLENHRKKIIDEFLALDVSVLDGHKDEMLNRFPNDWASIAQLIDARGRTRS
jgi:hypothetical protein